MSNEREADLSAPAHPKLHHIGFVVSSIKESAGSFARSLATTWEGKIFHDPVQKVRVSFFPGGSADDPLVELVEPAESDSPVSRFLERGSGLHHLCYEVDDLDAHLKFCKSMGTIVLRQPVPAVAFAGRRIAWAINRQKLLMEFLEREQRRLPLGQN